LYSSPSLAHCQQLPSRVGVSAEQQLPVQQFSGSISGAVVDPSGAAVAGAQVTLSSEDQFPNRVRLSNDDGQFSFVNVAPGPFQLTISAAGFVTQVSSGIVRSG